MFMDPELVLRHPDDNKTGILAIDGSVDVHPGIKVRDRDAREKTPDAGKSLVWTKWPASPAGSVKPFILLMPKLSRSPDLLLVSGQRFLRAGRYPCNDSRRYCVVSVITGCLFHLDILSLRTIHARLRRVEY